MRSKQSTGVKDMLGRDIGVGDVIAYATRQGSSTYQNIAIVEGSGTKSWWGTKSGPTLRVRKIRTNGASGNDKKTTLSALSRVVLLGMSERKVVRSLKPTAPDPFLTY